MKIPFPIKGISEELAFSEQVPGSTRDARNVRAEDPKTGRLRGAQRAGMRRFLLDPVSSAGAPVQELSSVSFEAPRVSYTELTSVANTLVTPQVITSEGSHRTASGAAFASAVDQGGNVFVLDGGSVVLKMNSAMEIIDTIPIPVEDTDELIRKLLIDELDQLYVAATSSEGSLGKVWRFSRNEDSQYELSDQDFWPLRLEGAAKSIAVRHGLLYVVEDYDEGDTFSKLAMYDVTTPRPYRVWDRGAPYPVNDLAVQNDGSIIVTSEKNNLRGSTPSSDNFTETSIGWTPRDVVNGDQRVHYHVDAERLTGFADLDRVRVMEDTRVDPFYDIFPEVTDATNRPLKTRTGIGDDRRGVPSYKAQGIGNKPSIIFDGDRTIGGNAFGGEILSSKPNSAEDNKETATDAMPAQRGAIPGFAGGTWGVFFVVRPDLNQEDINVFAFQKSPRQSFGILMNAQNPNSELEFAPNSPGGIVIEAPGATGGNGPNGTILHSVAGGPGGGFAEDANGSVNDVHSAVVSFIFNGAGNTGEFRVNGERVDNAFIIPEDESWSGENTRTTIGGPRSEQSANPDADVYDTRPGTQHDGYRSFFGQFAEWVTVLGDTSVTPHDTPLTEDEIERIEGYLAHKWGISHILLTAHPWSSTNNPPGTPIDGGLYSGTTPPGVDPDTLILNSPDPVLAKFQPEAGALSWAFAGPGVGFAVAIDTSGDLLTVGQRVSTTDTDLEPIFRKVIDAGTTYKVPVGAEWDLGLGGAGAAPAPGESFTLNDGVNPEVRFVFQTTLSGTPITATYREVLIAGSATAAALNLTAEINIVEALSDPSVFLFRASNEAVAATHVEATRLDDAPNGGITTDGALTRVTQTVTGGDFGAWVVNADATDEPSYNQPNISVDSDGDVYIPISNDNPQAAHLEKYDGQGNGDGSTTKKFGYTFSQDVMAYSATFGSTPTGEASPEHIFVTTDDAGLTTEPTVHKLRLLAATPGAAGPPRQTRGVAVSEGNVKTFDSRGGAVTTPTGGASAFDPLSPYVTSVEAYGKLYMTDGYSSKVYDPLEDTLTDWEAEAGGEVPKRLIHLEKWNGRIITVPREDPRNIYASEAGNPLGWDFFPPVLNPSMAWSLDLQAFPGRLADIIQAVIPASNETLLIGGDKSIHAILGDPARDFGVHSSSDRATPPQLVSDQIGMAFGTPWARSPDGQIFFMGSKGGIYVTDTATTVEISEHWIERRLADLDFGAYRIEMAWDFRRNGLMVAQVPYTAYGTKTRRWFWEKKANEAVGSGGWWEDDSASVAVQPTALHSMDADGKDDRVLLVGCEDGRIRYFDDDAPDDDGFRIASRVLIGPFSTEGAETRVNRCQLELDRDQDGAKLQALVAASADDMGDVQWSRVQDRGLNAYVFDRVRGSYVYYQIMDATPRGRWAFESLEIEAVPAGRRRIRS